MKQFAVYARGDDDTLTLISQTDHFLHAAIRATEIAQKEFAAEIHCDQWNFVYFLHQHSSGAVFAARHYENENEEDETVAENALAVESLFVLLDEDAAETPSDSF